MVFLTGPPRGPSFSGWCRDRNKQHANPLQVPGHVLNESKWHIIVIRGIADVVILTHLTPGYLSVFHLATSLSFEQA